jgi:hypothetical protein
LWSSFPPKGSFSTRIGRKKFAQKRCLVLLCGRYEGVDERVLAFCDLELSGRRFCSCGRGIGGGDCGGDHGAHGSRGSGPLRLRGHRLFLFRPAVGLPPIYPSPGFPGVICAGNPALRGPRTDSAVAGERGLEEDPPPPPRPFGPQPSSATSARLVLFAFP